MFSILVDIKHPNLLDAVVRRKTVKLITRWGHFKAPFGFSKQNLEQHLPVFERHYIYGECCLIALILQT
jgi:hypothetical protein